MTKDERIRILREIIANPEITLDEMLVLEWSNSRIARKLNLTRNQLVYRLNGRKPQNEDPQKRRERQRVYELRFRQKEHRRVREWLSYNQMPPPATSWRAKQLRQVCYTPVDLAKNGLLTRRNLRDKDLDALRRSSLRPLLDRHGLPHHMGGCDAWLKSERWFRDKLKKLGVEDE